MIRREARLRNEYLHKKSTLQQQQATTARKQALKRAFTQGTRISTDLKYQGTALIKDLLFDEHELEEGKSSVSSPDDEYSNAGAQPP